MMSFTGNKTDVARFAADILTDSRFDLASITIMHRGTSEGCFVYIATDTSLDDIVKIKAQHCSLRLTST